MPLLRHSRCAQKSSLEGGLSCSVTLEPLQAANAHAVLRTELTIGGNLAPSQARRKDTTVLVDHGLYRLAWLRDNIGEV